MTLPRELSLVSSTAVHVRTLRRDARSISGLDHDYSIELPAKVDHIDIFVDNGLVELFAEDGLLCITNLHHPSNPCGVVQVEVDKEEPLADLDV